MLHLTLSKNPRLLLYKYYALTSCTTGALYGCYSNWRGEETEAERGGLTHPGAHLIR